ncbi:hypothetical protein R1flu_005223 [Riccia fluitans]|uniref:Uncharacterized protein n=1 Tax=Riccia fluitans TaxID=41844 RepID=A0ABD1YVC4_9MARC
MGWGTPPHCCPNKSLRPVSHEYCLTDLGRSGMLTTNRTGEIPASEMGLVRVRDSRARVGFPPRFTQRGDKGERGPASGCLHGFVPLLLRSTNVCVAPRSSTTAAADRSGSRNEVDETRG